MKQPFFNKLGGIPFERKFVSKKNLTVQISKESSRERYATVDKSKIIREAVPKKKIGGKRFDI